MKRAVMLVFLAAMTALTSLTQTIDRCDLADNKTDKRVEEEFKLLHKREVAFVLSGDAAEWDKFYPEDHIVTNPFNQLLTKNQVLERVRAKIIRYKVYEKKIEYLCAYKDTVVIAGVETSLPADDANRPDAGKLTSRRFTETWIRRDKQWRKVARHVSTIIGH